MRTGPRLFVATAVVASMLGLGAPRGDAQLLGRPPAPIDAVLAEALGGTGQVRAIAVLDAPATPLELAVLRALGLQASAFTVLPMVAIQATPAVVARVRRLPFVESLWGDHGLELVLEESTVMIGADAVHAEPFGVSGDGVGIAILDSGIDATHPDLAFGSKTVENVKLLGWTNVLPGVVLPVAGLPNTDLTSGHGTHVAGIAAGTGGLAGGAYAGVAPGADLIGVGGGDALQMFTALGGYDWILANHDELGIRVINSSWADGSVAYDPDDPLNVASKMAHDEGITVVFAAGNDGQASGNTYNRYAWPDWVIGIAGVDKLGRVGDYSSRGDADHHATLSAPGSWIVSTRAQTGFASAPNQIPVDLTDPAHPRIVPPTLWPWYTVMTGTSMAAPHVAGAVALLLDADPTLTPDAIKEVLIATAAPVAGCPAIDCGAGLVDVHAAVAAVS